MPALLAAVLVFLTSGAVLVLEILAARLLAPYVGVTLETYTAIIGTVLAGIALGHSIGGRAADRVDPRRLLGPLLVGGGALALVTIPLVRFVGEGGGGAAENRAILLAAVGFFLPAAVLSAVSPAVVKLQLRDLGTTGSVVGRLSAIGTAGSIAGTFLAGFVLVEVAATSTSILVTGALLVAAGVGAWLWSGPARRATLAPVAVGLVVAVGGGGVSGVVDETCDVETTYHCARIERDPGRPSGRELVLDTLHHSYVALDDPTHLEFRYIQVFAAALDALAPAGPVAAVHVGGGGFTMPRYVGATRVGSTNLVLEIDGGLVDLARDHLGLSTQEPGLEVRVGDGRLLLEDVPARSADVVFGDAFGGLAVPWHLTSTEFVAGVRRVLRPGGVYVANLIDYPPLRFVRAELVTFSEHFEHVAMIAMPATVDGDEGGNVVLVGATSPIDVERLEAALADRGEEVVLVDGAARAFAAGAPVLTDDRAPVDQWLARSRR